MAKWGAFKFDTSTKYGAGQAIGTQPTFTGSLVWSLTIDWNGTPINEAAGRLTMVSNGRSGRQQYISGGQIERIQPGTITCRLNNDDGRYDPYDSGSPLYGIIGPDKPARLSVYVIATGVTYDVLTGKITNITPGRDDFGTRYVDIDLADGLQYAVDCDNLSINAMFSLSVDAAIQNVISRMQYPYMMAPETSSCPVYFFGPDGQNAYDVLNDLALAGMGSIFCDHSGTIRYYDLGTTGITTHTIDQATLLKDLPVSMPWNQIVNQVRVFANRYGTRPADQIWAIDGFVYIGPRETWKKTIKFKFPAIAIPPEKKKDYDPGFYYSAISGNFPEMYSMTLANITDTSAMIIVTNSNPDLGGWFGNCQVRGLEIVSVKVPLDAGTGGVLGNGAIDEVYTENVNTYIAAGGTDTKSITYPSCIIVPPVGGIDYYSGAGERPIVSGGVIVDWGSYFSVTLSNITTTGCDRTITNLDDTAQQFFGTLSLRGEEIAASSVKTGIKQLTVDSPYLQDQGFAAAYASLLLAHLDDPAKNPIIRMETRPEAFAIEIGDRIALTAAGVGINGTFDVLGIDFAWLAETGQAYTHTFYLGSLLYSAATITPQPFKPGSNPLPPEIPTGNPSPGEPTTPDACLAPGGGGLANGPYTFNAGTIGNDMPAVIRPNCTLRPSSHPYRARLVIDGVWESLSGGVWSPDATFDFTTLQARDAAGNVTATGTLSGGMVADGARTYYFSNANGADCDTLVMALTASAGGVYTLGDVFATGTIQANNARAVRIGGFSPGQYYAVETSGGPGYGSEGTSQFVYFLNGNQYQNMSVTPDPNRTTRTGGNAHYGYQGYFDAYNGVYGLNNIGVGGNYSRLYYKSVSDFYYLVFPDDGNYADNHGSLGYKFYNVSAELSDKRIRVRSISLYNVCPPR